MHGRDVYHQKLLKTYKLVISVVFHIARLALNSSGIFMLSNCSFDDDIVLGSSYAT